MAGLVRGPPERRHRDQGRRALVHGPRRRWHRNGSKGARKRAVVVDSYVDAWLGAREYTMNTALSVNIRATKLVDDVVADAAALRIGVARGSLGERLIDAGSRFPGGIAAGLRIAEICMGGLGHVDLAPAVATPNWPWAVSTRTSNPVIACLGSQYAGWKLSHSAGDNSFFALGSGPARALARREALFEKLAYVDRADSATLVLESAVAPPPPIVEKVARDCGLEPPQ